MGLCLESFDRSNSLIFYTNGMTTTLEEAEKVRAEIEALAEAPTELIHNDTTSEDKATAMVTKLAVGAVTTAIGLSLLINRDKASKEEKLVAVALTIVGIVLIAWGLHDYAEIQAKKNEKAKMLADRVTSHLSNDPHAKAHMLLHSQGADIGKRALEQMDGELRQRISVLTCGGMVSIPDGLAGRVKNFQNHNDLISQAAHLVFDHAPGARTRESTSLDKCISSLCHGMADYLKTPTILETLRSLNGVVAA